MRPYFWLIWIGFSDVHSLSISAVDSNFGKIAQEILNSKRNRSMVKASILMFKMVHVSKIIFRTPKIKRALAPSKCPKPTEFVFFWGGALLGGSSHLVSSSQRWSRESPNWGFANNPPPPAKKKTHHLGACKCGDKCTRNNRKTPRFNANAAVATRASGHVKTRQKPTS